MGLREVIEELIAGFDELVIPEGTRRRLQLPALPGKADVVVGMRRSGKTFFVYQQIRDQLAAGIPRDRILYLNFEDERLLPLAAEDLHQVTEAFFRRHPASRDQPCWFYFDEIQNVPGWERFIRRLLDEGQISIVLTGSSAKLLSREIATSLRGRSLSSELLPFSFEEALRHAGVEVPARWPPSERGRALLEHHFDRYLRVGGFPEVQELTEELRVRVLQDYVDVVLFRDVVERHGVENLAALRYLQRSLVARPANRFSVHKLYNDLKSQGIRAGKSSLYAYLEHLEDAFLVFPVPVASSSVRARQVNPRKGYLVDHALAAASSLRASGDVGHLLENVVYLELRRRGFSTAYVNTASGYEVDFLAETLLGERQLVQVCADVADPATRHRELRALREAMEEADLDQAILVSLHEDSVESLDGREVRIVPAWKWLLEPPARYS